MSKHPGVYVRGEWADLLMEGAKTIGTRSLPKTWVNQEYGTYLL